jgi:hypothetical protein
VLIWLNLPSLVISSAFCHLELVERSSLKERFLHSAWYNERSGQNDNEKKDFSTPLRYGRNDREWETRFLDYGYRLRSKWQGKWNDRENQKIMNFIIVVGMNQERPKVGVGVLLYHQWSVLLWKRKNAHGSGNRSLPWGHLEYGESPVECATRELKEETWLTLVSIYQWYFYQRE